MILSLSNDNPDYCPCCGESITWDNPVQEDGYCAECALDTVFDNLLAKQLAP